MANPSSLLEYEEAIQRIRDGIVPTGRRIRVALEAADDAFLVSAITATCSNPAFDNSAVDGYAIGHAADGQADAFLEMDRTIAAGDDAGAPIAPGRAVKILTGAPIPQQCYGIAMLEDTQESGGFVSLHAQVPQGAFIRRGGSDFQAGEMLLESGQQIDSGVIALMASQGMSHVQVYDQPSCAIVTTGDELVNYVMAPRPGQVRDTNGVMLRHAALSFGCKSVEMFHVKDTLEGLRENILKATNQADLALIVGGSSVGERDFVAEAVNELGTISFHGVAVRPGKPFLFAQVGRAAVFGLPGNPASAFASFHLFVREAIQLISGARDARLPWFPVAFDLDHPPAGREDFVRATIRPVGDQMVAIPIHEQGSFGLRSLAGSDCLVRLPAYEEHKSGQVRMALLLR